MGNEYTGSQLRRKLATEALYSRILNYLHNMVIKRGYKTNFFLFSTQLNMISILLINVKMPTTVGILTFISRINTTSDSLKASNTVTLQHCYFYEQWKFSAQIS